MTFPHVKHRIGMIILIDLLQKLPCWLIKQQLNECQIVNKQKILNCKILRFVIWYLRTVLTTNAGRGLSAFGAMLGRCVPFRTTVQCTDGRRKRGLRTYGAGATSRSEPPRLLRSKIIIIISLSHVPRAPSTDYIRIEHWVHIILPVSTACLAYRPTISEVSDDWAS